MTVRNATRFFLFAGIVAVLFFGGSSFRPTSTVSVSGKITWTARSQPPDFSGMTIFVGDSEHPWSHGKVDSANGYSVGFTHEREHYRFFITDHIDTLLLGNLALKFYDEAATVDFTLPKTYKKQGGKTICPVCEKTDKVHEIKYGDGMNGGCIFSAISPNWRCTRDRVNF